MAETKLTATELGTGAIKLGGTKLTSLFSTTTAGSYFDITGMSVTVTVPPGGRDLLIIGFARRFVSSQTTGSIYCAINEGATQLSEHVAGGPTAGSSFNMPLNVMAWVQAPSAGSHTYKLQGKQDNAGSYILDAGATYPAFIMVYMI